MAYASVNTYILKKYWNGRAVDPEDMSEVKRAARSGDIHIGSHVEMDDEKEQIKTYTTAKTTPFGRIMCRIE